MSKNIRTLEIIGFFFTSVVGTLWHFIYEWSGNNSFIGLIAPVNESTWEHLKLLFFPYIIFMFIQLFFLRGKGTAKNFLTAKTLGVLTGMLSIVMLFYTYTGVFGKDALWADILTFEISVLLAYIVSYFFTKKAANISFHIASLLILIIICILFFYFTGNPPSLPLFESPPQIK